VVHFVSLVQNVGHYLRRWGVHNGGTDDIGHIPMILILRNVEPLSRIELANGCKMDIASQYGYSNRFGRSNFLEFVYEPVSFLLVMLCCPMVVQVVQNLHAAVELVDKIAK
jgi:hypothetical protein